MKAKCVLFGHGNMFERKIDRIINKYDVVAILDNSVREGESQGSDPLTGAVICRPESVKDFYPDKADKVILLSYAQGEMAHQMVSLGVAHDSLVYGIFENIRNSFEEMLYDGGNGELDVSDDGLWYCNSRIGWEVKVSDEDIRSINEKIKDTPLYPDAKRMTVSLPVHPIDSDYGFNRGVPVDRYYIEKFMEENGCLIKGKVLEVGNRDYTLRFGGEKVKESDVIHKNISDPSVGMYKGNLESGEGFLEDVYDCFICTQTLPFIYDIKSAADNIVKTLKPGGHALVTAGGISQIITDDRRRYGHFWSFTDMSIERLFSDVKGVSQVRVYTYGNVKSATGFLYGLAWEELGEEVLDIYDPEYQVIIAAIVKKED